MVFARLIMVLLISGSISAPRGLMPCWCRAGEGKPAKAAAAVADARPVHSCCSAHRASSSNTKAPDNQKHPAPNSKGGCSGCSMPCCVPLVKADLPSINVSLMPDQQDSLSSRPDVRPDSLPLSGIFRPPRSLS